MMRTLEATLAYDNARVLNKFRTLFAIGVEEAHEIASDTHRWLWLNARARMDREAGIDNVPGSFVIHHGMVVLDEYWHVFILHTRDYAAFCDAHFGFFIHHSPGSPDFVPASDEDTEHQLSYIHDVLGADTLIRWYEDYPVRYSSDVLARLQRATVFGRPCEQVP